jgi:hypothetical protein
LLRRYGLHAVLVVAALQLGGLAPPRLVAAVGTLLVRPDGRLMVFWSAHSGSTMFYRISTNPEDIASWGPVHNVGVNSAGPLGYTYPNPIQLSAEDNRIYLFWRGGDFNPTMSTSMDGLPWSSSKSVIDSPGQRPYVKIASDNIGKIGLTFTNGHPGETVTSIYYATYRNGSWYKADGTLITSTASLPFTPAMADVVWDANVEHAKAWVHDVAYDAMGRPIIVFAYFPTDTDHHYRYARWDGPRWQNFEITSAGGSIDTDHSQPFEPWNAAARCCRRWRFRSLAAPDLRRGLALLGGPGAGGRSRHAVRYGSGGHSLGARTIRCFRSLGLAGPLDSALFRWRLARRHASSRRRDSARRRGRNILGTPTDRSIWCRHHGAWTGPLVVRQRYPLEWPG